MTMQQITITDASTGRQIVGKLIKRYERGLTIEDTAEVRYYATLDRVVSGLEPARPAAPLAPGDNGNLWQ